MTVIKREGDFYIVVDQLRKEGRRRNSRGKEGNFQTNVVIKMAI